MEKGSKFKQINPGDKFGLLTIIDFSHFSNRRSYWNCICECGKECIVRRKSLQEKKIPNCGCITQPHKGRFIIMDIKDSILHRWNCIRNLSHWEGECLIWEGHCEKHKNLLTPSMSFSKTKVTVRRWIYIQLKGVIPKGYRVYRTCNNGLCININHMEIRKHARISSKD